jgi:superfamily I DNA/RNA helicase
MLRGKGEIDRDVCARFDHVFFDEYQDTNRLQASILLALKPDGKGLTVVGDDAQSIYSFRAATVRNILDFPKQFTPPACIITLDRNYRSTQPILAAANAVIDLAVERIRRIYGLTVRQPTSKKDPDDPDAKVAKIAMPTRFKRGERRVVGVMRAASVSPELRIKARKRFVSISGPLNPGRLQVAQFAL